MNQQSLFDPRRLARTDNPSTSHDAARACRGLRSEHHDRILFVMQAAGADMTADEIAQADGVLDRVQVGKRLHELVAAGAVRITGRTRPTPSGRAAQTYEVVV